MQRETLEVDVLLVGAGAATLSCAIRLKQILKERGRDDVSMLVIEKGEEVGHHQLSGAVLDPRALKDLIPDYRDKGAPIAADVQNDAVYFLTRGGKLKFPITPPPLSNHGNHIISLNRFVRWLAALVEAEGVDIFSGFAASEVLFDGRWVPGHADLPSGAGRG